MEPAPTNHYLDYSMVGFEIANDLTTLDTQVVAEQTDQSVYDEQLTRLTARSLSYLDEGLQRFPTDFSLELEGNVFARPLTPELRADFALCFNELLYASISDPLRPIDAISDTKRLQRAVSLTTFADSINSRNFYEQPNKVRELGDAIIGRAILTMLSYNVDPRNLRIPVRN